MARRVVLTTQSTGTVIEYHLQTESSKATSDSFTNSVIEKFKESFTSITAPPALMVNVI